MTSDLRSFVAKGLRLHPRVAFQNLVSSQDGVSRLVSQLPPLTPFRQEYAGALCLVDWDHRLPSKKLFLRVYAYYTADALGVGEAAYHNRLDEIARRDKFPEFDVPDFDFLVADEAYEAELTPDGDVGRCRLTSAWRRQIGEKEAEAAVDIASQAREYRELNARTEHRPARLGGLEAVCWTPPCESDHDRWTIDVWYLLAFDGVVGTGQSFLVDLESKQVVSSRDFSVRTI